jgi:hypothetical protein
MGFCDTLHGLKPGSFLLLIHWTSHKLHALCRANYGGNPPIHAPLVQRSISFTLAESPASNRELIGWKGAKPNSRECAICARARDEPTRTSVPYVAFFRKEEP